MLTCRQLTELVTDYLEGRLSLSERLSFHLHVGMCRHCRAYLRQMKATVRVMGKVPPEPIPPHVRDALLARFQRAAPPGPARRARAFEPRGLGLFIAGLVSLVVVALGLGVAPVTQARCLLVELGAAGGLLAAVVAARRGRPLSTWAGMLTAAAGAVAGSALVAVSCPMSTVAAHLVTFHLGGVLVAAAAGAAVLRSR